MNETIFISIKDQPVSLIVSKEKNHEFRSRIPNNYISTFYVYTSGKTKKIEYIIDVDKPIKYPNIIDEKGIGNKEFNNKEKNYIYAFPIKHVSKLLKPLCLDELRSKFNFNPPQSFMYAATNEKLFNYIKKSEKEDIY